MRPPRLVVLAVTAALSVLVALRGAANAGPEEDREVARREFALGQESDKHKDWAGAIDHYLRANDLVEHPFSIYNIAIDYERLGKLREAGVWYRRYLDKATDPSDLARVRQQLSDLEARPGPLTIRSVPGGARAFVDDAPVGVTPITVAVKGGTHRVAIEAQGQRTEREVRLTYGEPQDLLIQPGAQPAALFIYGSPAGATVYVDNQPAGTLPSSRVPVTEGVHEIRVVSPGYAPFATTAEATPNGLTKVPVQLGRGEDGLATGGGTTGVLVGYYLGLGGGADAGGRGAALRTEMGLSASHYDFGVSFGKIGDDSVFGLGGRYNFTSGRISPFLGAEYAFTPSTGFGASAGLRIELLRSPAMSVALLAQVGAYRYTVTTTDTTGADVTTSVTAIPITAAIVGVFGRRVPVAGATPTPAAPSAAGPPGAP